MKISAILFDADGTLRNFKTSAKLSIEAIFNCL